MEQDLLRDLSIVLHNEFDKRKQPGEEPVISLPGSMGEALIVTDRRVIVIREWSSGRGCSVYPMLLANVKSASAQATGLGGSIKIETSQVPPAEPGEEQQSSEEDRTRVYFPSYDIERFKAAADAISRMAASNAPAAAAPAAQSAEAAAQVLRATVACPSCGSQEPLGALFCGRCGQELAVICAHCGTGSTPDAKFCRACGNEMLEAPTRCPSCQAHVQRWYTYCAQCGSVLHQVCIACGAGVLPSYKRCPSCGRELGSDRLDPAGARAAQARLHRLHEQQQESAQQGEQEEQGPTPPPAPQAAAPAASTAEGRNQAGQQLFDDGDMEGAIREFMEAVRLDPNNSTYHCNLAIAYDENDQDDLAQYEYERTLQLDPNDVTALLSLGYMYSENDEPERAKEAWTKVTQIAPLSAEAQEATENLRHQGEL